jgi:hypothetical protein
MGLDGSDRSFLTCFLENKTNQKPSFVVQFIFVLQVDISRKCNVRSEKNKNKKF